MRLAVLLGLAGAVLAWFSVWDRATVAAMYVVEWETRLGLPLYIPVLAAAALLALLSRPKTSPDTHNTSNASATRSVRVATEDSEGQWARNVCQQALRIGWEIGATLDVGKESATPFVLHLSQMPPASERRSLEQLATFLASIPTPPRVDIRFDGSQTPEGTHHHRVRAAFRTQFEPQHIHIIHQGPQVTVAFRHPNACWAQQPSAIADALQRIRV